MNISANGKDRLDVSGALTFETTPALFNQARGLLNGEVRTVNLAAVTRVDSSGLALLLEWQASSRQRGASLVFEDAPPDLLRLAELSESRALLGLSPRNPTAGGQPDETENA